MIDLENLKICLGGKEHAIKSFTVWWAVEGYGLFDNLELALQTGRPIQSMPVAVASDGIYEVLPPEWDNEPKSGIDRTAH
jgi:hypothetical protein